MEIRELSDSFLLPSLCYHSAIAVDVPGEGAILFVMCGQCDGHACFVFEIDAMRFREVNTVKIIFS